MWAVNMGALTPGAVDCLLVSLADRAGHASGRISSLIGRDAFACFLLSGRLIGQRGSAGGRGAVGVDLRFNSQISAWRSDVYATIRRCPQDPHSPPHGALVDSVFAA